MLLAIFSFILFIIDRALKITGISLIKEMLLIPKILSLEFYRNYGAAFGFKIPIFLIVLSSFVILFLIIIFIKKESRKKIPCWILLFLILGTASNLFDRIFYGYVIDVFNFLNFSFFNIADGMIIVGLIGVFWWWRKN